MVKPTSIARLDSLNLVILYLKECKRTSQTQNWLRPHQKKRERMFMRKQNKLAVLGVAEFVERVMIAVIGLGVATKTK